MVVGTIAASAWLHLAERGFAVIGPVPGGLPSLEWPDVSWGETLALLPVAASCFVMIIAQSAATSRIYADKHKERVDENADILGLAAANAAAAFSGAFVVNGSPTQTAMAEGAGARSQVAQLVFAAVVLVVLLFLTGPLQYLPRCVLASIVFTIAVGMIDVQGLRAIQRESRGNFFWRCSPPRRCRGSASSRASCSRSRPRSSATSATATGRTRWCSSPAGRLEPAPAAPGLDTDPGLIVYRFGADLFYANADRFADEVRALVAGAPVPVRWFVMDTSAITQVDYSAARTLLDLLDELTAKKVSVALGRVSPFLRADLDRHRITAKLGEARIFETLHEAIAAARSGGSPAGADERGDGAVVAKGEATKRSEAGS